MNGRVIGFVTAAAAVGLGFWGVMRSSGSLSGARSRRRGGLRGEDEARELHLYCENDGDIYRQRIEPIRKNLVRRLKKGTYDHEKSKKLWMYVVDACAKKYSKEFGSEFISDRPGVPWHKMFSVDDRKEVAKQFADNFKEEFNIEYKQALHGGAV